MEVITNLALTFNLVLTPFSIFILIMQPTNVYQFYVFASNIIVKNPIGFSSLLQIMYFFISGSVAIIFCLLYVVIVTANVMLAFFAGLCSLCLLLVGVINYQKLDEIKTNNEEIKVNDLIESGSVNSPNQTDKNIKSEDIKA